MREFVKVDSPSLPYALWLLAGRIALNVWRWWRKRYPDVVSVAVGIALFLWVLPAMFEGSGSPFLTVRILGSVILSAMIGATGWVIAYFILKA